MEDSRERKIRKEKNMGFEKKLQIGRGKVAKKKGSKRDSCEN